MEYSGQDGCGVLRMDPNLLHLSLASMTSASAGANIVRVLFHFLFEAFYGRASCLSTTGSDELMARCINDDGLDDGMIFLFSLEKIASLWRVLSCSFGLHHGGNLHC
jgi:hypothetical protein